MKGGDEMSSSRPWRKQTDGQAAAEAYAQLRQQPWYSLEWLDRPAGMIRDEISLGPDLVGGVQCAVPGLCHGTYAVLAAIPARRLYLPDWGSLVIRPRGWVLRCRETGRMIMPDRSGEIIWIGRKGAEL
jgi:hypothetical protein